MRVTASNILSDRNEECGHNSPSIDGYSEQLSQASLERARSELMLEFGIVAPVFQLPFNVRDSSGEYKRLDSQL